MVNSIYNSQNEFSVAQINGNTEFRQVLPMDSAQENSIGYRLSLSDTGWEVLGEKDSEKSGEKKRDSSGREELGEEEKRKLEELKKIDKEVRTHEQAHLNAAGGHARGGANYNYVTGPDGKRYANSGHVNLDTSRERTPEATIRKAEIIHKAALAPADPSPSDRQIASEAIKMKTDAQRELALATEASKCRK
jgi:hypothetical protein